ncbi:MAG: ABC transporter substrate-binding protein [Actinobacteria bacterium]|nr:ABC transporter substrate-binding protein [Actinomycetota bacterium]
MSSRIVLLSVLLIGVTGCGERAEPLGQEISPYPVSVRGAGDRPAVLNSRPERIVALDAAAAELVGALGAGDRLVGIPSDVVVEASRDAARVVGPAGQVRVETVVELEPDLVVAAPTTDPGDVARAQRETAAALYVDPDHSLDSVVRAALELALLVDEPVAGRRLAESIRRAAREVSVKVAGKKLVRAFIDTGFLVTVPHRSLLGDLVRRAGGESVAGSDSDAFTPCEVMRLEPDVLLTIDQPAAVRARFTRAGCAAGRVDIVQLPEALSRAGPRVGETLERIARALHPDAFA